MRGERIRDPVRPDLRGVVDAQTHPRFDARADDQSGAIQVTLGEACERSGEWWDHGPEHERVDVVEGKILARQKRIDHDRQLVLGLVVPCRGAPGRDELRSVVRAEDDVRVSDVGREQRRHQSFASVAPVRMPRFPMPIALSRFATFAGTYLSMAAPNAASSFTRDAETKRNSGAVMR